MAPGVRIEQTRRRLARLREEGLIERITLPQAGRRRVWFPTAYGVKSPVSGPSCGSGGPPGRRPNGFTTARRSEPSATCHRRPHLHLEQSWTAGVLSCCSRF
ncbi:hypothetical protein [Streptomyces pseudovenezuelae]|uniref:hypothetical protein n=1 Tax=Streptomyces pseudovenezuelae TaxID=67350 RepID=UPI0036F0C7E7